MRIPQRPAWPVVFLLASGTCGAADSLQALNDEIVRWKRIQMPATPAAMQAFHEAYGRATERWVARWPGEELAWRERLRALESIAAAPREVEAALAGAARTRGADTGLRFPEDTRFLMARTAVLHGIRLDDAECWLAEAVAQLSEGLPDGDHPLIRAYRQERLSSARWRAAQIRAEAAYRVPNADALKVQILSLTVESAVPVADAADRWAVAERARRRSVLFRWRARWARLTGAREAAACFYERALEARPFTPGAPEPPENTALIAEAAQYSGLRAVEGARIPPALRSAPHWLPTRQALDGFTPDGRPAIAVVWDGLDPRLSRALERISRQPSVRVLSFAGSAPAWIQAINPLYVAPQLWIVDPFGTIRLVGRFQPGGDGWEDAVAGSALRLTAAR